MNWHLSLLTLASYFPFINAQCSRPVKFYIDCGQVQSSSQAIQFCQSHGMTLVNLTNGTETLSTDILLLNSTFKADNCNGYFWFSSGSRSGLAISTDALGSLLSSLLTGVLNLVLCLIPFLCPITTTAAPITQAYTVCTRPTQQRVIQKCPIQSLQSSMRQFQFNEQSMFAGILNQFPSESKLTCSAFCSSNTNCVGLSYINGICTLYM